ncbi:MAG TPA: DMT family transporter [Gaiellaceae bacterium]|nr:DMT family transporter [Gaiellaceae bacterium]
MRGRRAGHGHARRATQLSLLALALALGSSVAWGTADFAGGSLTKQLPTFAVTVWSQSAGLVALVVVVAAREHVGTRAFLLGLAAGAGGGAGLAAFYKALSLGTMSVVSPLVACGALVPFVVSIATGERPSTVALVGALLALGGAVLASMEERRAESPARSQALVLAVLAAGALGLFVYFLGLGSREGDALSALFGARVGSLTLLVALAVGRRAPLRVAPRMLAPVAAVGLGDVGANALFAFASGHGLLSIVSLLGSLYPVVTVLLAHVLLGERLTRAQQAGVAVALAGVAAIATA